METTKDVEFIAETSKGDYCLVSFANSEKIVSVKIDFEDITKIAYLLGDVLKNHGIKCEIVEKEKLNY